VKTIESAVCAVADLAPGQMKQVCVGDRPVLLIHQAEGRFCAIAAHCSHSGAPLENGVLSGDHVICPWHNACFNACTGQQQEPPGLDDLASFETWVQDGAVHVRVPEALPQHMHRAMTPYVSSLDLRTFVILGAGAAGSAAAEQLRQSGFAGKIQMVTAEAELPYSRTALSKAYLQDGEVDALPMMRSPKFYEENGIKVLTNKFAKRVDPDARQIQFSDGTQLGYDRLLVATGGKARKLDVEGAELEGIYTLRSAEDARQILNHIQCKTNAVVIGSSFIGMEAASSLKQRGLNVTVVSPDEVPLERVLGSEVGQVFRELHEANGVQFVFGDKAVAFAGDDGQVEAVELKSGEKIAADLVVVGIGVDPATDFLPEGLRNQDQSVAVNSQFLLRDRLYAVGDIAQFPSAQTGESVRIEHWRLAMQQGRVAARNMAGERDEFAGVPFFWTGQFDLKLRYVGHSEQWDEVVIDGDLKARKFLAFYLEEGRIAAVAGCGRDQEIAAISELMRQGEMPGAAVVQSGEVVDWLALLQPRAREAVAS